MIMPSGAQRWIVAIPAKDESLRIADALLALDRAAARTDVPVCGLVYANNCRDRTAALCQSMIKSLRNLTLKVVEQDLPHHSAHAGGARRAAVMHAFDAFYAKNVDLLLSTDADTRVGIDLFREMEYAFDEGADLVAAKIACIEDPYDPCSAAALAWGLPAVVWRSRVRQLVETVRRGSVAVPALHDDYGGAGLAAPVGTYHALAGFPEIATNEDKTLVDTADARRYVVNRQSGAVVHVLARSKGRAVGGMADAIARDEIACAENRPLFVEHHAVTIERIRRTASHAYAFANPVTHWELAPDAIAALDRVINSYGHRSRVAVLEGGVSAG